MNVNDGINGIIKKIYEARVVIIRDIVRNVDIDSWVLPCFKAYILNSITLRLVSSIRKGKDVDINRLTSRIRRLLSSKIEMLSNICQMYREVLMNNPRIVVDIGCGLGLNLSITQAYIDKPLLLGIDKDLYFLKILKKLSPETEVILADASMLPLRNDSVEAAFCTAVLHELPNLEVITEASRVLKNNGGILISDVVLRFIPPWLLNIIRQLKVKLGLEPETPYTLKQVKSSIELQGMHIIKTYTYWKLLAIGIAVLVARKESCNLGLGR